MSWPVNYNAFITVALLVPLPFFGARYPKFGCWLSNRKNRLAMLGASFLLGPVGFLASQEQLVSAREGLYFWSPLWQMVVIQISYFVWFSFHKRPPADVTFNWRSGLFADRMLAMAILLLGFLVPVFVIGR